jgi:hypothetical protein
MANPQSGSPIFDDLMGNSNSGASKFDKVVKIIPIGMAGEFQLLLFVLESGREVRVTLGSVFVESNTSAALRLFGFVGDSIQFASEIDIRNRKGKMKIKF